jgi:hypothetical protein
MLSQLTEAMIVNGVVLATVLASDLGPARGTRPGDISCRIPAIVSNRARVGAAW